MNERTPPPQEQQPAAQILKLPLALVAGLAGAALGGWLTAMIQGSTGLIVPLPGLAAGLAVARVCRCDRTAVCAVAAACGFCGAVFGESLMYVSPGTVHYLRHFLDNGSRMDWILRVINAAIGLWFARGG